MQRPAVLRKVISGRVEMANEPRRRVRAQINRVVRHAESVIAHIGMLVGLSSPVERKRNPAGGAGRQVSDSSRQVNVRRSAP